MTAFIFLSSGPMLQIKPFAIWAPEIKQHPPSNCKNGIFAALDSGTDLCRVFSRVPHQDGPFQPVKTVGERRAGFEVRKFLPGNHNMAL